MGNKRILAFFFRKINKWKLVDKKSYSHAVDAMIISLILIQQWISQKKKKKDRDGENDKYKVEISIYN